MLRVGLYKSILAEIYALVCIVPIFFPETAKLRCTRERKAKAPRSSANLSLIVYYDVE